MLTKAFASTEIAFEKSMQQVEKMLGEHGIRESRSTHLRPARLPLKAGDRAPDTQGAIVYEFVYTPKQLDIDEVVQRRGVRITVKYQPEFSEYKTVGRGTTPEMAARALFWYLKAKFDSIDYGIEDFDVAFMPHLTTALGTTFAENPALIMEVASNPASVREMLALPAGPAPRKPVITPDSWTLEHKEAGE